MSFTKKGLIAGALVVVAVASGGAVAHAELTADSRLTQEITNGALSTDFRDASNAIVASPSFAMSGVTVSTSQQTSTGTFGDTNQRISVDNPGATATGWTLSLAAKNGVTATWTNGTNTYPYNDATPANGQLTIDPSVGTITARVGTTTNVTKGTSGTYVAGTKDSILLMQASSAAESIWNGYMTGVGVSQIIPASTPAGSYYLDMTQTVANI